jgi:hypothetical protein
MQAIGCYHSACLHTDIDGDSAYRYLIEDLAALCGVTLTSDPTQPDAPYSLSALLNEYPFFHVYRTKPILHDVGDSEAICANYSTIQQRRYYDNVRDSLDFHDPLQDIHEADDLDIEDYLTYSVIGWYSNIAYDPLGDVLTEAQLFQRLEKLRWLLGTEANTRLEQLLTTPDALGQRPAVSRIIPKRTPCHGAVFNRPAYSASAVIWRLRSRKCRTRASPRSVNCTNSSTICTSCAARKRAKTRCILCCDQRKCV